MTRQTRKEPTMTTYISPSLPGMIRNLWKSDPSERSVRTALNLAGDLIQELIDLRDQPTAEHQEPPNADDPTDAEVRAAAEEAENEAAKAAARAEAGQLTRRLPQNAAG